MFDSWWTYPLLGLCILFGSLYSTHLSEWKARHELLFPVLASQEGWCTAEDLAREAGVSLEVAEDFLITLFVNGLLFCMELIQPTHDTIGGVFMNGDDIHTMPTLTTVRRYQFRLIDEATHRRLRQLQGNEDNPFGFVPTPAPS
jgi:hypothetical protein